MVLPPVNGEANTATGLEEAPPPAASAPAPLILNETQFFIEEEKKALAADQVTHNGASAAQLGRGGDIRADSQEMSPIEIAMESGDMDKFETVLKVADRDGVLDKFNGWGDTPLGTAILKSNLPAIKALLKRRASPHIVTYRNESALHKAVHDPQILKYFLDNTDVTSTFDNTGLAPVHVAVCARNPESVRLLLEKFKNAAQNTVHEGHTPLHFAAIKASNEAAEVILDNDLEAMFEVNKQGDTPLHAAARHNNSSLAALLLRRGAMLTTKNKNDFTALELISNNFYDASNFFYQVFDEFICRKPSKNNNLDFEIDVNYQVLTNGNDNMSHMNVLVEFVGCSQSKVLIHPLIESFMYLKWIHFLPLFYAVLLVYAIFLVSVNVFVISVFHNEDLMNTSGSSPNIIAMNVSSALRAALVSGGDSTTSGLNVGVYWLLIALIYISISILLVQECLFIYMKKRRYFGSVESWVKLSALLFCAATPPFTALAHGPWSRHAACVALLLSWLKAMFLLSHFPRYGFYILMFGKVAVEILKILVSAIFPVIGFSFCFMIQYRSVPPFDGPFAAFVKTLVMMSSEFDYENLFGENHDEQLRGTSTFVRIMFMTFLIFVTIVLMNFMIGLAVNDINELSQTGNIKRLEKQVELLSTLDSFVYDGILPKCFKNTFGDKRYALSMSTVTRHQSTWKVKYGTAPNHKKKSSSVKIRSVALYNAIVEAASRNHRGVNKRNNICRCEVDRLVTSDEMGEESQRKERNSTCLREVIIKQNEQLKLLANQLAITSQASNEIKLSMEDLKIKIDYLLRTQTK